MEKNELPEGFTLSMALMDALPVLFFGGTLYAFYVIFPDTLFLIGAIMIWLAGLLKVCWKLVIAVNKKNIMILNKQMHYLMPAGFLLAVLSLILHHEKLPGNAVYHAMIRMPVLLFLVLGCIGICFMVYFAKHNDQMDAHSNWKEQGTNALAQLAFMIAVFLLKASL